MNQDRINAVFQNIVNTLFGQFGFALQKNLITLNGYNFTGIFVYEIFNPTLQHTGSQTLSLVLHQVLTGGNNFLCKTENLKNLFICLVANSTKQSGYR